MASKQKTVRQPMPGTRIQDAARDVTERRLFDLSQKVVHYADGDEYGFTITNLQDQDLYRTQFNLNNRWAIGVMNGLDPQVAGPGREGAKNNGNALFWRDLMLGRDRMYLDGDGQLRVQSASPAVDKVNDVLALQASSDAGAPQVGMGCGMVFEVPASDGGAGGAVVGGVRQPYVGFINAIMNDVTPSATVSYIAISAVGGGNALEMVQLWGTGEARWRTAHCGAQQGFKLKHIQVDMTGGADVTLANNQYNAVTLEFVGLQTANNKAIIPVADHNFYALYNNTSGGFTVQFIGPSGGGVTVGNGKKCLVFCDGTNYVRLTADV